LNKPAQALIFDIKRDSSEDGPGIRTTIFFKGCPLSCVWCQNPESKIAKLGISFDRQRCHPSICQMPCLSSCQQQCITFDGEIQVNHRCCDRCDACFSTCPTQALEPVGYRVGVGDLLERVLIDRAFFRSSGGGVTLSGGEPTAHIKFIQPFLKALKEHNIHTAIETCGYFEFPTFSQKVLPYLDLVYFDLKLFDPHLSKKYTGKNNQLIKNNLIKLAQQSTVALVPRIPLIPNITATKDNIQSWARFLKELGIKECELLPFNPTYRDKLPKLGINSHYDYSRFMTTQEQQTCIDHFYQ